jgi:integrase
VTPVPRVATRQGPLASRPTSAPIDRGTVSRAWHKDAPRDAGVRYMPLHALRHTALAAWLSAGCR